MLENKLFGFEDAVVEKHFFANLLDLNTTPSDASHQRHW